jgi:hypothetical protein
MSKLKCFWALGAHAYTQQAEIRRIVVQSQPGQIVHKLLAKSFTQINK